jgi:serine protease
LYTRLSFLLFLFTVNLAACSKRDISDRYIVVLKSEQVPESAAGTVMSAMEAEHQLGPAEMAFETALKGGVYRLSAVQAEIIAGDPRVAYVEKDQPVSLSSTEANATWGLDRIDQPALPLDHKYNYPDGGAVVNAYIIDTGILTSHQEFQGRAASGADFVDKDSDATDCNGHGTHVAGTVGGATYGVAKNVKLFAVRVLDCQGSGSTADVIAGIDWVAAHHIKPAVANMSLGGGASQAIDDAVNAAIQAGVTFAVAAGNDNASACSGSPSRVPAAITVGASNNSDARSSFSDFGTCVDLFAPGENITSSWFSSAAATNTISGTSMATPHVTGAAALYLSQHPSASPAEVANALVSNSAAGKLSSVGTGSPNLLLNIGFLLGDNGGGGGGNNGQPVSAIDLSGLSGSRNSTKSYSVKVPNGAKNLLIAISGGSGDADLYVREGSKPSASLFDCRPYKNGNSESCSFALPEPGTYYIQIKGYAAYSGLNLKASYSN